MTVRSKYNPFPHGYSTLHTAFKGRRNSVTQKEMQVAVLLLHSSELVWRVKMWCRLVCCEVGILHFRNRENKEEENETDGSTVINHGLTRIRCYKVA